MTYDINENFVMNCDALIISGTLEGCMAALLIAEEGYNVILIENSGSLGELSTNGLYSWFPEINTNEVSPAAAEFRKRILENMELPNTDNAILYHDQKLKVVLSRMLRDAGITVLTHVFTSAPLIDDNKLKGFKVYGKTGCLYIYAKTVIDASDKLETVGTFSVNIIEHQKPVSIALKLNNIDFDKLISSCDEIYTNNSDAIIAQMNVPFSSQYGNMTIFTDKLHVLGNKKYGELIINGMKSNSCGINPIELSMIQIRMHCFAYELLNHMQNNYECFKKAHIIHVAPKMNVYGLRTFNGKCFDNIFYCNNRSDEYYNNKAISVGIETGKKALSILSSI